MLAFDGATWTSFITALKAGPTLVPLTAAFDPHRSAGLSGQSFKIVEMLCGVRAAVPIRWARLYE